MKDFLIDGVIMNRVKLMEFFVVSMISVPVVGKIDLSFDGNGVFVDENEYNLLKRLAQACINRREAEQWYEYRDSCGGIEVFEKAYENALDQYVEYMLSGDDWEMS